MEKTSYLVKTTYGQYKKTIMTSIMSGTILLIALAWNDVVQSTIHIYYPKENRDTLTAKLYYASIVTLIIVALQIFLFPIISKL